MTAARVAGDAAADLLVQRGYFEAVTYSFIDAKAADERMAADMRARVAALG